MGKLREPLREMGSCGLPMALEVMGERWSFMILRAAFNGLHHFEEYLTELGIARNILSNRLARLVESGIMRREPLPDDRRKIEYRLTEKGFDLLPAMLTLRQWGREVRTGRAEQPGAGRRPRRPPHRAHRYPRPRRPPADPQGPPLARPLGTGGRGCAAG